MMLSGIATVLRELHTLAQDVIAMLQEVRALAHDLRQRGDSPERPPIRPEDMVAAAAENERLVSQFEEMLGGAEESRTDKIRVVEATPQWPADRPSPVGAEGTVAYVCGQPQLATLAGFGQVSPGGIRWEVVPDVAAPSPSAPPALTEDVQWVFVTGANPEWVHSHSGAVLAPFDDPTPVALVSQGGTPVRVDGIPGAPAAAPEGLTWSLTHPKRATPVAAAPLSP